MENQNFGFEPQHRLIMALGADRINVLGLVLRAATEVLITHLHAMSYLDDTDPQREPRYMVLERCGLA